MSEGNITVKQFLRYYLNENGKKTLNMDLANKWLASGCKVVAVLTNQELNKDLTTEQLTSISFSMEERSIVLFTTKKERYFVKKKLPGFRYVEIDHFVCYGQVVSLDPEAEKKYTRITRESQEYKDKILARVKKLVKEGKSVNGVYYESRDCRTITSIIKKVNLEEKSFETDMHIIYYIQ